MKKIFLIVFTILFLNLIFIGGVFALDASGESGNEVSNDEPCYDASGESCNEVSNDEPCYDASGESCNEASGESGNEAPNPGNPSDIDASDPTNSVNKSAVGIGQEFVYTIYQEIPLRTNSYTSFVVEDVLEDCLAAYLDNVSVVNELGDDVTDLFDLSVDGQKITFTLLDASDQSFYGHDYSFTIKTYIKSDADLDKYMVDDKYVIGNVASVIIDDVLAETNNVYVNYTPKVVTNVPKTSSMYSLWFMLVSLSLVLVGLLLYINMNKQKGNA